MAPRQLTAALLAVGAAVLWAIGTVLGRMVSARIASRDVTVLRFAIGLPTARSCSAVQGAPVAVTPGQLGPLVLLALIPGLLGLTLYYIGLRATAAARATLAELAFPVTATLHRGRLPGHLPEPHPVDRPGRRGRRRSPRWACGSAASAVVEVPAVRVRAGVLTCSSSTAPR